MRELFSSSQILTTNHLLGMLYGMLLITLMLSALVLVHILCLLLALHAIVFKSYIVLIYAIYVIIACYLEHQHKEMAAKGI